MITIFTIPKPFLRHINIIQRNAIKSWLRILPKPEIILFGDEEGIDTVAKEFGILNIPKVEKNKFGTPVLNSVFDLVQKIAKNQILVYINTDIILMSDFIPAIKKVREHLFLLSGRRWDLEIKELIQFNDINWEKNLWEKLEKRGKLHGFSGIDYFVFPRNLPHDLPSFAVGRPGWDNWLIYHIKSLKIPVIDATKVTTVIHQNHPSIYRPWDEESQKNFKLAGGFSQMLTLRDTDWILTPEGLKNPPFSRRISANLSSFWVWRKILSIKRGFQHILKHGK
ncbi:hypothetical protein AMJ49_03095 [Parcubacteria bacterium DG_74_2]|nr:MAG: hypothetical protein AMJ49_03095 [Parcubacteria bacterium DG_74_2]